MIIQISSGQGPAECELAVEYFVNALKKEFPDLEILRTHKSRFSDGLTSALVSTECDFSSLEGSIQWICKSPVRPDHKRKNWFIDVSVIPEVEQIPDDMEIRWELFHCGGHGGQNVNKVESGVRLIHIPTGITVTSTEERSQFLNKKTAMNKLNAILADMGQSAKAKQANDAWREHTRIIRGNPVRVYEGEGFKRKI
ncbi:MAG: peptide chain release factor H [Lachnospiraceae bacterium]|nr:peptide chain release factor H [Candidatus Hippenecus merdae]